MSTLDQSMGEQPKVSYSQIAINYGLYASLLLIVISLIFNLSGFSDPVNPNPAIAFLVTALNWGIIIGAMIIATKKHREEDLGGFITFGRAFGLAFLVGVVIMILTTIFNYLYFEVIDPSMMEAIQENFETQIEDTGADEDNPAIGFTRAIMSPIGLAVTSAIGGLFSALILGLISAAVSQKKRQTM